MKIGFLGCGNMAKAIINGIIKSNFCDKKNIYASAKSFEKLSEFCSEKGINAIKSNEELLNNCDIILLCTKPQMFKKVLPEISKNISSGKLFISIAAGKTLEFISDFLGDDAKIIRVMPNLNASISCSVSAICSNENCNETDTKNAQKIFEGVGETIKIAEKDFSAFSAVACCSPAFSFMYIDALAKAGEKFGLSKDCAFKSAVSSVLGSAKMLQCSADDAQTLVKKVCSPGGTTIEGVNKLNEAQFQKCVEDAVRASYEKDKIL